MATRPYDPGKITIMFRGKLVTAVADGTFVKAARAEKVFKTKVGAQGDVIRTRVRNKMGSVTVTLQSTSDTNTDFSTAIALDELNGTGYGTLLIKDNNGTTVIEAQTAWLDGPADFEAGDDSSNREYTIACGELKIWNGAAISLAG